MPIIAVKKMGEESLLVPSLKVENYSSEALYALIEDMKATMKVEDGIGIAAPQIGCNQRIVIFGFEHSDRYPDENAIPFTVLINPTIKPLSEEMEDGWEGCLSIPGMRGLVPRYTHIEYSGFDVEGNEFLRSVKGFHARVVQHEVDHLDGILYPHRIKDMRFFGFQDVLFDKTS
ncbi:MAG: peptide deformylase [Rickettsiella sp.]|nr:peptide deformylase [Rickettsiella sp.]